VWGKKPGRRQQERLARVGEKIAYLLHQVRSPVVTIGLLARSLQKSAKLNEKERHRLDQIVEQATVMESMLQDTLGYLEPSRPGHARVNTANLIQWVITAVLPQAAKANVSVMPDAAKGVPAISGHRRLLRQALLNVVKNGIEACGKRHGAVVISARATEKSVVIEVIDTGEGMPPEAVEEAFAPFHSTKERGTGLGLPLTRKVVGDHSGRISINSEPGAGTKVAIRLPIAAPEKAPGARES